VKNEFLTTSELAKQLGISRVAVFKKIKNGQLRAVLKGRTYLIRKEDADELLGDNLPKRKKENIEKIVNKAISDYGETFKLLGRE